MSPMPNIADARKPAKKPAKKADQPRSNEVDEDFVQFCRQATDAQLVNILADEYDAYGHRDYPSARIAAAERGWIVKK